MSTSQTLAQQMAEVKAQLAMAQKDLAIAQAENALIQRRLRAAEQGVPGRYVRNADWDDVTTAFDADRGGQ